MMALERIVLPKPGFAEGSQRLEASKAACFALPCKERSLEFQEVLFSVT